MVCSGSNAVRLVQVQDAASIGDGGGFEAVDTG